MKGDGVNDVLVLGGQAPNPVGTQDFAFGFVFRTGDSISGFYLYRGDGTTTSQYGLYVYSDGRLEFLTNNASQILTGAGAILPNTTYKLFFKRTGGRLVAIKDGVEVGNIANSMSLVSLPHVRIFGRTNIADGSTHVSFVKPTLLLAAYADGDIPAFETWFNRTCQEDFGFDY